MTRIDHLMKAHKIATRLKEEKPKTVEDLLIRCGLTLKFIGDGGFREVFKIVGTGLIVKVPIQEEERRMRNQQYNHTPTIHSRTEWKYRKQVMRAKKYEFFRPYMPAYHYLVNSTGILLADYYRPLAYGNTRYDAEIDQIIANLAGIGVTDGDVGPDKKDNYGIDRDGKLRIIDLGCFGGELQ